MLEAASTTTLLENKVCAELNPQIITFSVNTAELSLITASLWDLPFILPPSTDNPSRACGVSVLPPLADSGITNKC